MHCAHCGQWNQRYHVTFKGPGGLKVMRGVYSASSKDSDLETKAREELELNWDVELMRCSVWALLLEKVQPITEKQSGGPEEFSRPS